MTGFGLSYWLDWDRPTFPRLDGNLTTDVAIIGAGISGLKLARCLSRYGVRSVILESGRVGEGASGRNQGSICYEAGLLYAECIAQLRATCGTHARAFARGLWQLGLENMGLARIQIAEYEIDCGLEVLGMHSLAREDVAGFQSTLDAYRIDHELLRADGFRVALLDEKEARRLGGNAIYAGGFSYLDDAQLHSGKYVVGLAQGVSREKHVRLYEGARMSRIESRGSHAAVITDAGVVTAVHVFLATNALAPQHVSALADSLRAERGQVFVTEPLAERPCVGSFSTSMAWWREIREPDSRYRLLFGGGRRRDEPDSLFRQFDTDGRPHPRLVTEGFSPSDAHQRRLDAEFAKLFPHLRAVRITHRWGGLQSFTADHLPVIGVFDPQRRIHGMAGFSGRGNTYSDVGAELLAARVAGVSNAIETRFGVLIDKLMAVGRASAKWGRMADEQ